VLDFIKAIRFANVILVALAQIFLLHKHSNFSLENITLILLTSLWISWGNIDNDIQDVELDTLYKKKVENKLICWLSKNSRDLYLERICLLLSLGISLFIGMKAVLLTIFAWSALKFYNLYLKKLCLIGNLMIALLCMASLHVFNLGNGIPSVLLSCLIFTATFLREVVKDKEDEIADKACGYNTLAIKCNSSTFKIILFGLGLGLNYFAYIYMNSYYYVFVGFLLLQLFQWYFILVDKWKNASLMIKMQILIGVILIGVT
jgi:4-hydroxybenzoate polyprenyltransferase